MSDHHVMDIGVTSWFVRREPALALVGRLEPYEPLVISPGDYARHAGVVATLLIRAVDRGLLNHEEAARFGLEPPRYLVFAPIGNAAGGWKDLLAQHRTLEEAVVEARAYERENDAPAQVVDLATHELVEFEHARPE